MAIEFARPRFIQRSKGHNVVQVAAYNMRDRLYCERTGERTAQQDPSTLVYHEILLPAGADRRFAEAGTLWNAAQAAEHRKDSQEAFEVVLALPADRDITDTDRIELTRSFARDSFTTVGRAVQIDIHRPHPSGTESQAINYHAHLLVTTRRIEGDHLGLHKAVDLVPKVRTLSFGKPIVAEGELWGPRWRDHQNKFFSDHGKVITVDPVAPIPGEHLGPIRFRHPKDYRLQTAEQAHQLNAKIARDPQAVADHMRKQAQPFDGRALDRFLTKYLPPDERESVAAEVRTRLHNLQREALQKAAWSDKTAIGGPQSVEYVARQLSPEYAELLKRAAKLREDAQRHEWERNRHDLTKEAGTYREAERWAEMNVGRRLLHLTRVWRDGEVEYWDNERKRGAYTADRSSIRRGAAVGELDFVTKRAEWLLDQRRESGLTLRQEAALELERRQKIARNAREGLDTLQRNDKVMLRARRSQSRGANL